MDICNINLRRFAHLYSVLKQWLQDLTEQNIQSACPEIDAY
jgi:hypothetical protein